MDWQFDGLIIILALNVIGWVFAYGKFVGRVNGFLKKMHDPPCQKLNELQDKLDEKLNIIADEIVNIRERLVKIETKLENKK